MFAYFLGHNDAYALQVLSWRRNVGCVEDRVMVLQLMTFPTDRGRTRSGRSCVDELTHALRSKAYHCEEEDRHGSAQTVDASTDFLFLAFNFLCSVKRKTKQKRSTFRFKTRRKANPIPIQSPYATVSGLL